MVTKIHLRDEAVQHLEALKDFLPDAGNYEDVIEVVAWHYAREHADLKVALDGSIESTDDGHQTEVEA